MSSLDMTALLASIGGVTTPSIINEVTPVTPEKIAGVTKNNSIIIAVTPVTPVTPQKNIPGAENEGGEGGYNTNLDAEPVIDVDAIIENARAKGQLPAKDKPRQKLTVEVYTPAGDMLTVEARDEAHAQWLRRVNPKPSQATENNPHE
jgi:hypothetical protein